MIKSMTGFGRGEFSDGKRSIVAEIRAVNHRYSDIAVKLPRRYSFAEERVRSAVKEVARRGKIEVSVMVEHLSEDAAHIRLNLSAARQAYDNLMLLKAEFGLKSEVELSVLAGLPDVMKAVPDAEDEEEMGQCLETAVREAARRLDDMRTAEGAKLAEDMLARGRHLKELVGRIEARAPRVAETYTEKMRIRIREMMGGGVVPEDRILLEAAIFADKSSITEELVRLDSHLRQLETIVSDSSQPDGKRLDFLIQEMNREANTIGSKANDMEITAIMLEMKSEIEKLREQVQNVE